MLIPCSMSRVNWTCVRGSRNWKGHSRFWSQCVVSSEMQANSVSGYGNSGGSGGSGGRKADESELDPLDEAFNAVESLYAMRDTYFPKDPLEKKVRIQRDSNLALAILDAISPERRKQSSRRAVYEYLRGKVLDVLPDHCKEAEDHLSKAVKLDPSLADAWLCLGNCFWKKGDLTAAKNCFNLALNKGPNKKILRQLSMLERQLAQGTANEAEAVEESIQHAKEAIMLDVKDGQSWYALGNAYLTSFFITGAWDQNRLHHSLKAYQNAEKDELANSNPDLYFNSATVNRYLENYERALSSFETASLKDPGLKADEEVQKLVQLLTKLENSTIYKGQIKSKKFASLISSLGKGNRIEALPLGKLSMKPTTLRFLHEGLNTGLAVMGRVLLFIQHENAVPLYYLISDADGSCFVLSVYGLRNGVIKESDTITLLEPSYHSIHVSWKDKTYLHSWATGLSFQFNSNRLHTTNSSEWKYALSTGRSILDNPHSAYSTMIQEILLCILVTLVQLFFQWRLFQVYHLQVKEGMICFLFVIYIPSLSVFSNYINGDCME